MAEEGKQMVCIHCRRLRHTEMQEVRRGIRRGRGSCKPL
jgi:hypothetical protein